MKHALLIAVVAALVLSAVSAGTAQAIERKGAASCAYRSDPWHAGYYHVNYGMPLALVVPPTAELQTNCGRGVGNYRVTPICHQFRRYYPGPGYYNRCEAKATPLWPSDTNQFGVYYVRGPW